MSNEDTHYPTDGDGSLTLTNEGSETQAGEVLLTTLEQAGKGLCVGSYRLEQSIGRGGMGEVFAARHLDTGERVALKWFADGRAGSLHRFKREFRSVADVKHENLISLGELVVLEDSRAFFTMELVDGELFHEYVRGPTPARELPDMPGLERALRQLVSGVAHLHARGIIHRDLKPSNVLVAGDGRVVILDFGLVSELGLNVSLSPSGSMLGTPAYIAPEHAARERAGKPSDLYAVGVMLFQCLCGELPFSGSVAGVLARKQEVNAPDIRGRVPGVPPELAALCMRLLARDPEARPSAGELLRELTPATQRKHGVSVPVPVAQSVPSWTGLLGALSESFAALSAGPLTVHLRHQLRAGRNLALDRFFDELRGSSADADPPLLLLRARCHQREFVPYKGIDQIVDALTLQLSNMDEAELRQLEPSSVSPLLQMFPVLGGVWPMGSPALAGIDKGEQRRFGVAALRELLARAAQRYRLVVCIEDFQWADVDGAAILSELVRSPEPPQILLIVTYSREALSAGELEAHALDVLMEPGLLRGREIRELELPAMSAAEARELGRALVGSAHDSLSPEEGDRRLAACVEGAEGDPFLLSRLIAADLSEGTQRESLGDRVVGLSKEARRMLALLSLAEGACAATLLEACGVPEVPAQIEALLGPRLVRWVGTEELSVAHDSIRAAALADLSEGELRALHRAMAGALHQAGDERFESIAAHFVEAGEAERGAEYLERAGDRAAQAFAFRGAAELYTRALALVPEGRERGLEGKLADQLVAAGKGDEAIALLERLAQDAEPTKARAIRRQVADLYIQSGRVSRGLAQIEPVFEALGERVPQSPLGSLLTLLWRRLTLSLRGTDYTLRPAEAIAADELEHLDTLLAVWTGLTHQSPLLAAMVHARYFRLALDVGEALHLIRGFNYESVLQLTRGREAASDRYMAAARQLIAGRHAPVYEGVIEYSQNTRKALRHEWREGAVAWPRLIDRLEGMAGTQYLRALAASRYAYALVTLGDYRTLDTLAPEWLQLTQELGLRRDDAIIAALAGLARLMLDPGDDASVTSMLARARAWDAPGYSMPNFHIDLTEILRSAWRGEYEQALETCARASRAAKRWRLTIFELVRFNLADLRGRTCVLVLSRAPHRTELAKQARQAAKLLRQGGRPMYRGQAEVIEAGLCAAERRTEQALRHWGVAAEAFEVAGMEGHVAAVRLREAQVRGGAAGEALRAEAEVYLDAQRLRAHERFMAVFAPAPDLKG